MQAIKISKNSILYIILALIILIIYWKLQTYEFLNYDDNDFVIENEYIRDGFSAKSLSYAFTDMNSGIWLPVTWLSHIFDCQLFGLNPMGHHWNNLIFHIINSLLVFIILQKMTGAIYRSFFVAVLFAAHPIQIESVAWVSERKNVLSTFFYLITILNYIFYSKSLSTGRYLVVIFFYILGLMSKPMMVTMPFALLLLDYWPLGRITTFKEFNVYSKKGGNRRILLEKVPFLIIAIIFSIISFQAQYIAGAMTDLESIPINARIELSLVSYVKYLFNLVWPVRLAFFYPYSGDISFWEIAGASFMLFLISVYSIRCVITKSHILFGWLWFLGTMFPVIGLVHLGDQSMADRYLYIPCIGIFVIIVWEVFRLSKLYVTYKASPVIIFGVATIILVFTSISQMKHWRNNITLYSHAIEVTENNYVAHGNLGAVLLNSGKTDEAIYHLRKALEIKPQGRKSHFDLGTALAAKRMYSEAKKHFNVILKSYPDDTETILMLGRVHFDLEEYKKSIDYFSVILKQNPNHFQALEYLGKNFLRLKKPEMAKKFYFSAIKVRPDSPSILFILGTIFHNEGDLEKAEYYYKMALKYKPDFKEAIINLKNIRMISKSADIPPQ